MTEIVHIRDDGRGGSVCDYWPLLGLFAVAGLGATALLFGFGDPTLRVFLHAYLGVFLIVFAFLKISDLEDFKEEFALYDLLGSRTPLYGYVYPFIELFLGLAYLAFFAPTLTYLATVAIFAFGAAGILNAMRRGLDIDGPAWGTVLGAPLVPVAALRPALRRQPRSWGAPRLRTRVFLQH